MATSSFVNKQMIVNTITFAPNNFTAILEHGDLPNDFHIIQNFLLSSPISYALQTKCSPNLGLKKDDENPGNDGGAKETSDAARLTTSKRVQFKSQTKQSTHVSETGARTVRTIVESQVLTEEQFLPETSILIPGQSQTLEAIPEEDEDLIIRDERDAPHLFQKYKTNAGEVVTLFHQDKRVQQFNARKALALSTEEFPDLSKEEFLKEQQKLLKEFTKRKDSPDERRGRGRGVRGRRGRGRKSIQAIPRQTRSSDAKPDDAVGSVSTAPLVHQPLSTVAHEDVDEEESQLMIRRKGGIIESQIANSDMAQTSHPDEAEILTELQIMVLTVAVDMNNLEYDEMVFKKLDKERDIKESANRAAARESERYVNSIRRSSKLLWKDDRRQIHMLEKSYSSVKEKDKKWKNISMLNCNNPIQFRSGQKMTSIPLIEKEGSGTESSKYLWTTMKSNLRGMASFTRGGIGSSEAEFLNVVHYDQHCLVDKLDEELTVDDLWKLEAVDIVADCQGGSKKTQVMLYFMKDGSVKKILLQELLIKSTKELKYVHYLLKVKNEVCALWSRMILSTIRKRFADGGQRYDGDYIPMYSNFRNIEVEMQKNSAVKELVLGMRQLTLNPDGKEAAYILVDGQDLERTSIQNLRAGIYQINEGDVELSGLKERLIQILEYKEEEMLSKFLKMNLFYQRISETDPDDF